MESSSTHLSGDDIERILEETLSDSESSLFDSDDNSSAIEDMSTHEASDSDSDSARNSTSPLQGGASDTSFMWEDMYNYVGRRERFIGNSGPQNEAKNVTEGMDAFKMLSTQEVIEIIIRETNTCAEQCIKSRVNVLPLRLRMRDWKPVTTDEIYSKTWL
jgi:hypothetical protein